MCVCVCMIVVESEEEKGVFFSQKESSLLLTWTCALL
jgi:hypothetical protein